MQGGISVNGGLMRGDIDIMGDNFDRLYDKLKVLLLLVLLLMLCYVIDPTLMIQLLLL